MFRTSTILLSALGTATAYHIPRASSNSSCRAIPGDAAWPSTERWSALNETVSGRLIATVPLPSVCHSQPFNVMSEGACTQMKTDWLSQQTFLNAPAEVMNADSQGDTCSPFTPSSEPCDLGNYASYSIRVSSAEDAAAGLAFAHENNIRMVIKNSGHDFAGKSTGKGSLSLWMHHMDTLDIMDTFTSGDYTGPAAKLGAGVIAGHVYEQVGARGYRILGGTCPTVGLAGGYTAGAGHSLLNGAYGMGADAVLEWEVVTADGKVVIATPTQNSDLYWAMTGGGAGTWGVVLSMTTKIFPDGPIGSGTLSFNMTSSNITSPNMTSGSDTYWEAIESLWAFLPEFVDSGPNTWDFALTPNGFEAVAITVPDKTGEDVEEILKPLLERLQALGIQYSWEPTTSDTYVNFFGERFGPTAWPANIQLASRLIPRSGVEDPTQLKQIVQALKAFNDGEYWSAGCHALNVKNIEHPDNAILPQWRDSIAICNIVSFYDWDAGKAENSARQEMLVDTLMPGLEKATPGAGTYLNEIDAGWKGDWKTELYGVNYERLLEVKNKYDPNHVLYGWTAVGSDSWTKDDAGRLCRI